MPSNDRSHDTSQQSAPERASDMDQVSSLLRTHASRPPYDAVDWDAVAARIVSASEPELQRRRAIAGRMGANVLRGRVRAWWEVTAGWARPAVAAAVAMIAVASALMIRTPVASIGSDNPTSTELTATTDGDDAVMLAPQLSEITNGELAPITRDSLFSAAVDGR